MLNISVIKSKAEELILFCEGNKMDMATFFRPTVMQPLFLSQKIAIHSAIAKIIGVFILILHTFRPMNHNTSRTGMVN